MAVFWFWDPEKAYPWAEPRIDVFYVNVCGGVL